ncbi:MAG: hypothetical protein HY998_02850 [candidate division NC10 bacterium]|nr:hypothetical protein [candidate division NC10 bacterium]
MGKEGYEKLEAEILKEKAEALGRTEEHLDSSLKALKELEATIDLLEEELRKMAVPFRSSPDLDVQKHALRERVKDEIKKFNTLREQALRYRHYLIIQREALGFGKHPDFDRLYPIPPPRQELKG